MDYLMKIVLKSINTHRYEIMGCCHSYNISKDFENNIVRFKGTTYKLGDIIGSGAFGSCVKCVDSHECVKIVKISDNKIINTSSGCLLGDIEMVFNEIKILKRVDHANIIKYVGDLRIYGNGYDHIIIITKFIEGVELFYYIHDILLTEMPAVAILQQIANGIHYLHSNNIIHGDIKPENIIINPITLKIVIIDLGSSHSLGQKVEPIGTDGYKAPELFIENYRYDKAIDIWAFGCIAFILIATVYPYTPTSFYNIMSVGQCQPVPLYKLLATSPTYRLLVYNCLHKYPHKRFKSLQLVNFIKSYGIVHDFI